jgi:hypothetical protein
MNAITIGARIGMSFSMMPGSMPPAAATFFSTSFVLGPNTLRATLAPSSVSMSATLENFLPRCAWRVAAPASDWAPPRSWAFAAIPATSAGTTWSIAAFAVFSSMPSCFAMSPTGIMSSRPSNSAMGFSFTL